MGVSEIVRGIFEGTAYAFDSGYISAGPSREFHKTCSWQRFCNEDLSSGSSMIDEPFAKTLATWPTSWLESFIDDPLPTFLLKDGCRRDYTSSCDAYEKHTIFNNMFRRALFFASHEYRCQDGCCTQLP